MMPRIDPYNIELSINTFLELLKAKVSLFGIHLSNNGVVQNFGTRFGKTKLVSDIPELIYMKSNKSVTM